MIKGIFAAAVHWCAVAAWGFWGWVAFWGLLAVAMWAMYGWDE